MFDCSYRSAFLVFAAAVLSAVGCTPPLPDEVPFGVSPTKAGYIPARIALVSCMSWPERSSRMKSQAFTTANVEDTGKLCAEFDQFVAAGFDNQPFMKGYSPKFVERLYGAAGMTPQLNLAIAQQWQAKIGDCATCATPAAFYNASIAPRKQWTVWLSEFSKSTATKETTGADALLLPIIVHYSVANENDRGLVVARRSAFVSMLLIDISSGELIWSGGREADVVSKAYAEDPRAKTLQPPDQEELKRRLFTDALWLGFPGRQVYK